MEQIQLEQGQNGELRCPGFARTKPRHQLELVVEDPAVLQDTLKLAFSFLDRTQGQISLPDRRKIETFLRSFVPLFFMLDPTAFNAAFVPHHESIDSDFEVEAVGEDVEMGSANGSTSSSRSTTRWGTPSWSASPSRCSRTR